MLLEMSVRGGILIAAVAAVRALFLDRAPKSVFIAMWSAIMASLLLPIGFPRSGGEISALGGGETVAEIGKGAALIIGRASRSSILTAVWIAGAAAAAIYFASGYFVCRGKFSTSLPARDGFCENWLKSRKMKRNVTVRLSSSTTSPLTYGIINPVILLPESIDLTDRKKLETVLAHELTHIRKFDCVLKFFSTLAVVIHWFNPAVWAMRELLSRDIELRCDECVIKELGLDPREYAELLIGFEAERSRRFSAGTGLAFEAVAERIRTIMSYKKKTLLAAVCAVIIAAAMSVAVFAAFGTGGGKYVSERTITADEAAAGFTVHSGERVIITASDGGAFSLEQGKALNIQLERVLEDGRKYPAYEAIEFGYYKGSVAEENRSVYNTFDGWDPAKPLDQDFGRAIKFGSWMTDLDAGDYYVYIGVTSDCDLVIKECSVMGYGVQTSTITANSAS